MRQQAPFSVLRYEGKHLEWNYYTPSFGEWENIHWSMVWMNNTGWKGFIQDYKAPKWLK
jgi:hypothetical protein